MKYITSITLLVCAAIIFAFNELLFFYPPLTIAVTIVFIVVTRRTSIIIGLILYVLFPSLVYSIIILYVIVLLILSVLALFIKVNIKDKISVFRKQLPAPVE